MLKVGIVNPLVSPEELANGLRRNSLKSVAVYQEKILQTKELDTRFKPELFDEVIYIDDEGKMDEAFEQLKNANIQFLANGFDNSCHLTDVLANRLNPELANNPATSAFRYDKAKCQDHLGKAGLNVPNYLEIHDNELTDDQINQLRSWSYPVILKPANAAGTEGYFECANIDEVKRKITDRLSKRYGYLITSYLIQEKLIGEEYAIDTFSFQGKHYLIHIRKYYKENYSGVPIPRIAESILPSNPMSIELQQYMIAVLDVIGLKNGFCHAEVFVTKKGMFAIDINPRIPGLNNASCILAKESYGRSHVDVLSQILLQNNYDDNKNYQYARIIYLQNLSPRIIKAINEDKIKNLPSFRYCISNNKENKFMSLPTKLSDTIGYVILVNKDFQQLEKDSEKIFTLEANLELF